MSQKLGIAELIRRVGDEKITLQNLGHCFRGARNLKGGGTEIQFGTEAITATELMNNSHGKTCLILWLPTDAVQQARADHDAEVAPKGGEQP